MKGMLRASMSVPNMSPSVRLVSVDYGKTIRWSGRGPVPQDASTWLARVRKVKGASSRRLARAYNAPISATVYQLLLEGGIDLIGTEDLEASRQVLHQLGR